ncbi:hypothetical protein CMI37_37810 [Candidatus Pacearchaeota archaeon]|nr:hypothetical protein [Candidatus Pacearchaeota archaeon]
MPRIEKKDKLLIQRLRENMRESRKKLEQYRELHRNAVKQYVGGFYSRTGSDKPRSLNLIELAVNVYERNLAARPPKVNIVTRERNFRPIGKKLEAVINEMLTTTRDIHQVIQSVVKASLFSIGICKVGIRNRGEYSVDGYQLHNLEPYMTQILLDDWVHDMSVRRMSEISFAGHRFQIDLDEAKERKDFDSKVRKNLQPIHSQSFNDSGDERIHTISQGASAGFEESFYEKVELWEVWLPKSKQIVTLTDRDGDSPLKIVDWVGPKKGPYHWLYFDSVDGQTMPLPPVAQWLGLDATAEGLMRKLDRQAQRAKVVGVARGEDSEDAERIRKTSDGDIVGVQNPDAIQEKMFGGIDQRNFAFMLQIKELFSWRAGNIDALGGLGPQSETLGQDRLLFASANQRVSGMQDAVVDFTKRILEDYAYYVWANPVKEYPATLQIKGLGAPIETTLSPSERPLEEFQQHQFNIEPYSMSYSSPHQRLQNATQILQTVLMPMMPLMQQQGLSIDVNAIVAMYSEYGDLPELKDLIVSEGEQIMKGAGPAAGGPSGGPEGGAGPEEAGLPQQTHRINERRNVTPPQQGQQEMVAELMGQQGAQQGGGGYG